MKKNDIKANKKLHAIDIFSGCGGLTLGLKKAGFSVSAAVEIDPKAQETYQLNHPDVRLYGQDIRTLNPKKILDDMGLKKGELDLLAGCPPCQGFSRLRTKNRQDSVQDERNNLVIYFLRLIKIMEPKTVMLENVPALAKDDRFQRMCRYLENMGYSTICHVLDTADYAVPQRRKRLIMLASKIHTPSIANKSRKRITVRQALKNIKSPEKTRDRLHGLGEKRSLKVKEIISLIPKNGGSRSNLPERYQLNCHKICSGFNDVYGRMAWDTVAPTITSGCHNPSKGRFLHPAENRSITLREASILQGFPRNYKFNITHGKEAIALMIGNALPPPFVAAHAKTLKKALEEVGAI